VHYQLHLVFLTFQVMKDDNGNSRGFGFVSFEEHDSALKVKKLVKKNSSVVI